MKRDALRRMVVEDTLTMERRVARGGAHSHPKNVCNSLYSTSWGAWYSDTWTEASYLPYFLPYPASSMSASSMSAYIPEGLPLYFLFKTR